MGVGGRLRSAGRARRRGLATPSRPRAALARRLGGAARRGRALERHRERNAIAERDLHGRPARPFRRLGLGVLRVSPQSDAGPRHRAVWRRSGGAADDRVRALRVRSRLGRRDDHGAAADGGLAHAARRLVRLCARANRAVLAAVWRAPCGAAVTFAIADPGVRRHHRRAGAERDRRSHRWQQLAARGDDDGHLGDRDSTLLCRLRASALAAPHLARERTGAVSQRPQRSAAAFTGSGDARSARDRVGCATRGS